ncbi:MAG: FAD-dependent oxidoreductase [Bacteroidota bacterium]
MNRDQDLARLRTEEFDVLVIGGGASGAGCALDSVLRGYKTALIDKTDFAAETSSRSTKLIHGGVRYLEQAFTKLDFGQLAQVKHGLQERHTVLRNAPHLTKAQALITPVFSWFEGMYYTIGLKLYGAFASSKDNLPGSRWLSKKEAEEAIPGLSPKVHSAVLYYDGQLDDARYCLAIAQTAAEQGAAVVNHLEILDFEKNSDGQLTAARGRDTLTGEEVRIKAKVFLNCTGPFADYLRQKANADLPKRLRPSKGVHAILPEDILGGDDALLIPATKDGRVVFAIPFYGKTMLGTTDDAYDTLDREPVLDDKEVDYLLETLARYVKKTVQARDVTAGFGGLRPLVSGDPEKGTASLLRDHQVEHDKASNLVSLLGGKWTTYRVMAQDAMDYIAQQLLPNDQACTTERQYLVGGEHFRVDNWQKIQTATQLPEATCRYLSRQYGDRYETLLTILQENAGYAEPLVAGFPYLKGEVIFAARHEMACTVRDFLARRIRLEILDWDAAQRAAGEVARLLGNELGWPEQAHVSAAEDYIDLLYQFREEALSVSV